MSKKLLIDNKWTKCEIALVILPLVVTNMCLIFKQMIKKCKISKLRDYNFKVLHHILATPVLIAKVWKNSSLQNCAWCGQLCTLEHLLLECAATKEIKEKLDTWFAPREWIFGVKDEMDTKKIWVINYALYKAHLIIMSNISTILWHVVREIYHSFSHLVHDFAVFNDN